MKTYVYALIINEESFLVLQRPENKKSYPLYWNLPGGKLEENESYEEGVKREVMEETGLDFDPVLKVFDEIDKFGEDKKVIVFLGFTKNTEIVLNEEHIDFKFISPKDVVNFKVMPYINKMFIGR